MSNSLVTAYVDEAIEQLRRLDLMRTPRKLPESMLDISVTPMNDWVGWRATSSTVTDADLDSLELETGLAFPPTYRTFLKYRHFVGLTEVGVRFKPHLSHDWKASLTKAYFHTWQRERILDVGLLPFGDETLMDAGPVCFDTCHRDADGDCPVVFWDHDSIGTNQEVRLMFSSSLKMFECLSLVATHDNAFIHDDDADASQLMQQFLSLDPKGAGGVAREYWTSWIG